MALLMAQSDSSVICTPLNSRALQNGQGNPVHIYKPLIFRGFARTKPPAFNASKAVISAFRQCSTAANVQPQIVKIFCNELVAHAALVRRQLPDVASVFVLPLDYCSMLDAMSNASTETVIVALGETSAPRDERMVAAANGIDAHNTGIRRAILASLSSGLTQNMQRDKNSSNPALQTESLVLQLKQGRFGVWKSDGETTKNAQKKLQNDTSILAAGTGTSTDSFQVMAEDGWGLGAVIISPPRRNHKDLSQPLTPQPAQSSPFFLAAARFHSDSDRFSLREIELIAVKIREWLVEVCEDFRENMPKIAISTQSVAIAGYIAQLLTGGPSDFTNCIFPDFLNGWIPHLSLIDVITSRQPIVFCSMEHPQTADVMVLWNKTKPTLI